MISERNFIEIGMNKRKTKIPNQLLSLRVSSLSKKFIFIELSIAIERVIAKILV